MRLTRLIIGMLLIAISIWIVVGEQMGGASANAMVNARLATLRTPIAGRLALPDRALGAAIREGEELGAVTDALVDRVRLNDLVLEWQVAQGERDRLGATMEEIRATRARYAVRAARFKRGAVRQAEIRLSHARARLALLETRAARAGERVAALEPTILLDDRPDDLGRRDLDPEAIAPGEVPLDLAYAIEVAREEVGLRSAALEAARDGVFLGDGYNDSPFSEQRLSDLNTRLDATEVQYRAQVERVRALAARVTEERISVNRLGEAALDATVNGRLWEVLAADGERVERGQEVMRLLDCDNLLVTASVSESLYNRLLPGDPARFRLSGTGEVFEATVERLAGSGAATIYRNLAVAPGGEHLQRYDVAVSVPGLPRSEAGHCPVGRTGRVFFEKRPLDWLRDLP